MKIINSNKTYIFIYLISFIILFFIYILIPGKYITKIIVKPITKIDFDNKVFELSIKHKNLGLEKEYFKKVFEDNKKVIIKIENVDNLLNNSPSPLVLFYEFFRIVENQNYEDSKFQINFFENSFEYFFIISIKGKNVEINTKNLLDLLHNSNKTLNINFNQFLLNSKIDKKFDINEFNFVDVKLNNFKSKLTKINFKKFLLFNLLISLFLCLFIYAIKIKFIRK